MNLKLTPTKLRGSITPPPSKSQAHRLIIAAALAGGVSTLNNLAFSQDITATLNCMSAMGTGVEHVAPDCVRIHGLGHSIPQSGEHRPSFDCGESGSTLRFLIPIALAVVGGGSFTGRGRLMERPQKPYFDLFDEKGIFYEQKDGVLTVQGTLIPGEYLLPGDVSSQFITGLLYALPLLKGDSVIKITTKLESLDYVAMTLDTLKQFGIRVERENWRTFRIPGGQMYQSQTLSVEADWSQAGFWYAAQGIGNDIEITGMNPKSIQGDRIMDSWARMMRNERPKGGVTVPVYAQCEGNVPTAPAAVPVNSGYSVSLDVSHSPDLVPPLAAWGALMNGALYIKNAARLRIKESDRLATVTEVLNTLGAKVIEGEDRLMIEGQPSLSGGVTVSAHNDHRIAMMAAIAATCCETPIVITGAQCVAKSYPNFWEEYVRLGGIIEEVPE